VVNYFRNLATGKLILWCYLLWYCVTLVFYFDPSIRLWLNSVGISVVIGFALQLSVQRTGRDPWQTFRLFMMPFCVSSFSSLIKGQGFWLILPPKPIELLCCVGICVIFVGWVKFLRSKPSRSQSPAC
jgi:hypothetical protein